MSAVLGCMPIVDGAIHTDGSVAYCHECSQAVWLSDSSAAVFAMHPDAQVWCLTCVASDPDFHPDIQAPLPEQMEDLARNGVTPEMAQRLLRLLRGEES